MTEGRQTVWPHNAVLQFNRFLSSEAGGSGVLVLAIVAALLWANLGPDSYRRLWELPLSIRLGTVGVSMDLRSWISDGLMTFFFLLVGLEARRDFDLGSLRERSQFVLPVLAGLLGMAIPVGLYLLVNAAGPAARGWGVAMSTDTALALGLLSIVGRGVPERVKGFLLTLFIVDDLASLVVIAVFYSHEVRFTPLVIAALIFALLLVTRRGAPLKRLTPLLAVAVWLALLFSGVDPLVAGLALGLSMRAYVPGRDQLETASGSFRQFREQPTPRLARDASVRLRSSLSDNEWLQSALQPWTSYLIVPLFALANAGIRLDSAFLRSAYAAPLTLGVMLAYVVGKPLAVIGSTWLVSRLSGGRLKPPVGWAAVAGTGTIAGVGFTVSVLVASLAFGGAQLDQAKLGVLTAALAASILTWLVYRVTARLPRRQRARALFGETEQLLDLNSPVDPARDHLRGPADATVTILEYGDFQCPFCGQAEPAVRAVTGDTGICFVWRHLPIREVHPQAQLAAEAAEAASAQGAFWAMHDLLLSRQDELRVADLLRYAEELGLDAARFERALREGRYRGRVEEDLETADQSGVSGTPTFFINGRRHYGAYDAESLRAAVLTAREEAERWG